VSRSVLLLRAVNVGGHNRVPMAELRELLAANAPLTHVSTYIASGNIICDEPQDAAAACARVRELIAAEFHVDTPVIPRTHRELVDAESAQPFADGPENLVHATFLEVEAAPGAVVALQERLVPGERIALIGRELWIRYPQSGAQSTKLTRAVLDRALATAGTARNLRTVRALITLTA